MAILNRFSAILLYSDLTNFLCASRCRISGDSRPATLGIVRFSIQNLRGFEEGLTTNKAPKQPKSSPEMCLSSPKGGHRKNGAEKRPQSLV